VIYVYMERFQKALGSPWPRLMRVFGGGRRRAEPAPASVGAAARRPR
jgi:hypothetical protein